ncbi:MAG: DUF971 domain-containing protein [Pseudomonadaceae bacterium]|nr:DUF971 domain-containing protein [Pseudomonadaceae bacterium]
MIPSQLRLSANKRTLVVTFGDTDHALTAEALRINSPSAEVKGHFGQGGVVPTNKHDVTITSIEPVGNYAVKLTFSDGHNTGLFTWDYLHELAIQA